jgi:hypothetical protein
MILTLFCLGQDLSTASPSDTWLSWESTLTGVRSESEPDTHTVLSLSFDLWVSIISSRAEGSISGWVSRVTPSCLWVTSGENERNYIFLQSILTQVCFYIAVIGNFITKYTTLGPITKKPNLRMMQVVK